MNERQIAWAEKWEAQIKEIKEDLENIENLKYEVKEMKVVATVQKRWWKTEKVITLNSLVTKEVIKNEIKEKLNRMKCFFNVVTEEDFMKCRCSHKSGSSDCEEKDCRYCNCSFDFFESDINKILKERVGV